MQVLNSKYIHTSNNFIHPKLCSFCLNWQYFFLTWNILLEARDAVYTGSQKGLEFGIDFQLLRFQCLYNCYLKLTQAYQVDVHSSTKIIRISFWLVDTMTQGRDVLSSIRFSKDVKVSKKNKLKVRGSLTFKKVFNEFSSFEYSSINVSPKYFKILYKIGSFHYMVV